MFVHEYTEYIYIYIFFYYTAEVIASRIMPRERNPCHALPRLSNRAASQSVFLSCRHLTLRSANACSTGKAQRSSLAKQNSSSLCVVTASCLSPLLRLICRCKLFPNFVEETMTDTRAHATIRYIFDLFQKSVLLSNSGISRPQACWCRSQHQAARMRRVPGLADGQQATSAGNNLCMQACTMGPNRPGGLFMHVSQPHSCTRRSNSSSPIDSTTCADTRATCEYVSNCGTTCSPPWPAHFFRGSQMPETNQPQIALTKQHVSCSTMHSVLTLALFNHRGSLHAF